MNDRIENLRRQLAELEGRTDAHGKARAAHVQAELDKELADARTGPEVEAQVAPPAPERAVRRRTTKPKPKG